MKKLKLTDGAQAQSTLSRGKGRAGDQTDLEDFTSVGEATLGVVDQMIESAIDKCAGDMLRENISANEAKAKLKSYVERWERLEEERAAVVNDMNEVIKEAEHDGFDKAALKTLLGWRKKGEDKVKTTLGYVATYHDALGMDVLP